MKVAVLFAAAVAAPLNAQAYQCTPPARVAVPAVERDGPVRRVPTTGYTLALSWSPEFCKPRVRQPVHARQCSGRAGRFGLVVHGLWPEGRGTNWPQWCPAARGPRAAELARNLCISPSARLLAHEWAKHGACMTRRPDTYFKVMRIMWRSLRKPDLDRLSRQDGLTVGDLREAFVTANPSYPLASVGVKANARGWLQEIRLCYGRDFRPRACDRRRYGAPDRAPLKIWRGL